MSFTSSDEVNNNLISSDITISKGTVDLNTNITTVDWVCCTVSNGSSEVTVCRADGNLRRACRRARRLLNQQ